MENEPIYANRVYDFLAEIAKTLEANDRGELLNRTRVAMKHYVFPLTSEFLGISMAALQEVIERGGDILSVAQIEQAKTYIKAIKNQYFS